MNSHFETHAALTGATGGAARWMGAPNPRQSQWRRSLRWLLGMQAYLALWFWGIILVLEVLALVVAAQFGTVEVSMFQFATHGALWFPFSMMIIASAAMITTHVAQGRTRRSFIQAALITVAVMALGYGVLMTVGLALEGAVYEAMGWAQTHVAEVASDSAPVAAWQDGVGMALLTYTTRTGGGAVAGLLVGVAYYRFGGWRGTGLLLLTALPALAAQEALSGLLRSAVDGVLLLNGVLLLVLIVGGALAYYLLTRNVPINNPRS